VYRTCGTSNRAIKDATAVRATTPWAHLTACSLPHPPPNTRGVVSGVWGATTSDVSRVGSAARLTGVEADRHERHWR
jgi:hypothetical protein